MWEEICVTFGGGDGGRFDRGNMPGRTLAKARLEPGGGDGVCLRTMIGERDVFLRTADSELWNGFETPWNGPGGDRGRLRISGERGRFNSGERRRRTGDGGERRRTSKGEERLRTGDIGGDLRLRERLR